MKIFRLATIGVWLMLGAAAVCAGDSFDTCFLDRTLRIDYYHTGDAKEEFISLDHVYLQGIWAGSRTHLLDDAGPGRYTARVHDAVSDAVIFSRSYDTYFGEYKSTNEALQGVKRTYQESVLIPCPKQKIRLEILVRDRANALVPIFSQAIDPGDITVNRESLAQGVKVFDLVRSGDPHVKVDLAILAEGYTAAEEKKLQRDLARAVDVFFKFEPYRTRKNQFNVTGVFLPSQQSGCDEPSHGSYKNTALGATFDSLGSERYLLTEENRRMRDIAAHVPYDALLIMVNHKRYGGGGIYNLFCVFTSDNQWFSYLLLHEFGHSFAGLADEYYTSSTAYNEFYPAGIEPMEPNITALLNPPLVKWQDLLTPGVSVPTPWEKEEFDKMDLAYQKIRREINEQIARMKREGAPAAEVAKVEERSEKLSKEQAGQVDEYLRKSRFWNQVGVFQGAGYASEGLYRSMADCLMFTKGAKPFCRVCQRAVEEVIGRYGE